MQYVSWTEFHVRKGTQKCPEMFKKYLIYSYKSETSVPLTVLPLWLDATIPAPLRLLETLSEIFNENAVNGHQRFSLNLCKVGRTPPFQILVHPWEQKKVAWSVVGEKGEGGGVLGLNYHFVFSQKGGVLLTSQRFNENRWRPLTAVSLKISDNVSSSGSGAGIAASSHRGSTVSGTEVSNSYEHFQLISLTFPGHFLPLFVQGESLARGHKLLSIKIMFLR